MNTTPRFAVIGHPIGHSKSPLIHKTFGQQLGIDLVYDAIQSPVDQFDQTVQTFFKAAGVGLNVTVPFKEQAWHLSRQHLSSRAKLAGAVNTLWQSEGQIHGCNTDGVGLIADLSRLGVDLNQKNVLIVGAGGASRGILGPLMQAGCKHIRVVNRTPDRAHQLISDVARAIAQAHELAAACQISAGGLTHVFDPTRADTPSLYEIVINATASGLSDQAPVLPDGLYASGALAYDMMYGDQPTAFMRQAHEQGAHMVSDGLGMLVEQAAESFYIWHGVKPQTQPVIDLIRASFKVST